MGIGTQELIVIMAVALLIFGPKRLPEIGKSVGSALRELRRASNDFMSVIDKDEPEDTWKPDKHEYQPDTIAEPEDGVDEPEASLETAPETAPEDIHEEHEKAGE